MNKIFKPVPEKNYNKIIKEIGNFRYYIYNEGEPVPGDIFSRTLALQNYKCVVAGTGDTRESYTFENNYQQEILIPKGEQIVVVRLLRYDDSHGDPHYNADDQLIFPIQDGRVFRVSRNDVQDHYLKITATANMLSVADAFKLPTAKYGPVEKYSEKGASLHIEIVPTQQFDK